MQVPSVSPKLPLALTTIIWARPYQCVLSPYQGWEDEGAQGGHSVTLRESELPVDGATEQFGLPTVQKGAGVQMGAGHSCAHFPRVSS